MDNGGDNMKLHGAERDVKAITLGSLIVIIKEHDIKFDIYEIKIREIIPPLQNCKH